ncbi:hypothetical protein [Streptomyces luteogriseus]|uniref:Uncharacterized protein n=1 Tax=Streptomyces luteogriseus TaxID=68233 RepID=A0A7W7DG34_9ACTN|nr:hypothetical protein [Streptomyces luteogriseus]MBB4710168.1 hypothetical protein [Streptomyces luteogriseus]
MVNIVWHTKLRIYLDLARDDLGHPELPDLWVTVYRTDRLYAARGVPVAERDLQCGGVCQEAGVEAWMHLRLRAGRREAVHEKAEDEDRHTLPMSTDRPFGAQETGASEQQLRDLAGSLGEVAD